MEKKRSLKFWIFFWSISCLFLAGWFLYWNTHSGNINTQETLVDWLPIEDQQKGQLKLALDLSDFIFGQDNVQRTFLVLFQNNMEIRPGGGFIGSFGILKILNGKVADFQIHDTGNFDARIPNTVAPPYPMAETLHIKFWQLRDSNFSPDFLENAKKAEEFYYMGQGGETFDGIMGITTNVLTSFLKATGPVEIPGYPGTYKDEDAVLKLEYQVEKAYEQQGIQKGDRKSIMNDLGQVIMAKVFNLSQTQKLELAQVILEDLNRKDIQIFFRDPKLQEKVVAAGWAGQVDADWKKDFLMPVDANLGSFKSDYFIKRSFDYSVDLTGEIPKAVLKITYQHNATQKDWMTKEYLTYLRVYVPDGSWLVNTQNFENPKFGNEFGKKYFGDMVYVKLGETKTVILEYNLPKEIKTDYDLKIQKQAGLNNIPVSLHINGKDYKFDLNKDTVLNNIQ
ncbi:MAG: DUF4012 domain-containing protein [Candidatus Moranbacteria bacterium]|nr:DUF4012 domain-containing protein [Candidatus Moranbacteria bacterium]